MTQVSSKRRNAETPKAETGEHKTDLSVDPVLFGLRVLLSLMIAAKREPGNWKCQAISADCVEPGLKLASGFDRFRVNVTPHNTSRELAAFSVKFN